MRSSNSRAGVQYARNDADRDALRNTVIAFAVTLQTVFLGNMGTLGVAVIILTLAVVAATSWRSFVAHLLGRPLPHIFWVLALVSTLWSIEPAITARFAIQLALTTFIGMLMTGFGRGRGAIQGIALAFVVFLIVSLVAGRSVAMGASGGTAFSGLTGSKNLLAGTAAFGFLSTIAAAYDSFERGKAPFGLASLGGAMLALYVVFLARSSGALLGLGLITPLMVGMLASRRATVAWRSVTLIVVAIVAALALVFIQPLVAFVTDVALQAFNKDPTLTGRVYLWQRADEIIQQRPWFGVGYNAFWVQGHIDAEGLWRWGGITGRIGFNFHNTMRETVVTFGWVGFSILLAGLVIGYALFTRTFVLGASALQVFWLAVLTYFLISVGWESFLPGPFSLSSFLTLAAFCAACSPVDSTAPAFGYRRNIRRRPLAA